MRRDVRIHAGILASLTLCLPLIAQATSPAQNYAYAFPLQVHAADAQAYRIALTPAVYAASQPQAALGDIAVVDADGQAMPLARYSAPEHDVSVRVRLLPIPMAASTGVAPLRVEQRLGTTIVVASDENASAPARPRQWLLDAGEPISLRQLDILPQAGEGDFDLHVAIDASNDLAHWQTCVTDAALLSLGDSSGVQRRRIDLSGPPARYYRMRVLSGDVAWDRAQAPRVMLTGRVAAAAHEAAAATLRLQATTSAADASGGRDYDFTLPGTLPVQGVRVSLPASTHDSAVRAQLSAQGGTDKADWMPLANLAVVRVAGDDGAQATFQPRRLSRIRVHVDTDLAAAPSLVVTWQPDTFAFLAGGREPYRLLVGSRLARHGDYPVDDALVKLRAIHGVDWQPPLVDVGQRERAAGEAALRAPFEWGRLLLWLVLVVGALIIVGMAVSLLKQSSSRGED